ncbi:MAG TPA: hypothetical protein PLO23_08365 [Alphaproteobacteria bacterium]|nr:hypothetical protein [Alphaproteobacteria bacterium]
MDALWLQTQFEKNPSKSKAELARALGLEPPAISKIIGGARQIKAQEYMQMRRFFGLPLDGDAAASIPLRATHSQGLSDRCGGSGFEHNFPETRPLPTSPKHLSEQLEPEYARGDHVLVDTTSKNLDEGGVFILCDGFSYMIRECSYGKGAQKGKIRISARQPGFQSQTLSTADFLIIGRVVGKVDWV